MANGIFQECYSAEFRGLGLFLLIRKKIKSKAEKNN